MWSTRPAGGAPPPSPLPLQALLSRTPLIASACVAAAALLAWAWLAASAGAMAGMQHHGMAVEPWTAGYLLTAFGMWALMMVAMMLPSAAPMILLVARVGKASLTQTILFAVCYLLVWTGFSLIAAAAQALLIDLGLVGAGNLAVGERAIGAALLLAAALYQLTAAKTACLDQCRSPLHFVLRYWRPGARGAVRLGLVHGAYCLGCCWALMLLLFVGGVMNLAWVALVGGVVLAEKLAPPAWHASKAAAVLLAAGAVAVLVRG